MNFDALGSIAPYLIVFCRVGACLMALPGYASPRIPVQARLFAAMALSIGVTPMVEPSIGPMPRSDELAEAVHLIAAELLTGTFIGLLVRMVFATVQLAGSIMTQVSGYSGATTVDDGSGELAGELGALLSATVLVLLFILDLHVQVINVLIDSYSLMPFGILVDFGQVLDRFDMAITQSFRLATRVCGPFILAGVVINFTFGIVNKVAPQIPAVFIVVPFALAAALWILLNIGPELAGGITRHTLETIGKT